MTTHHVFLKTRYYDHILYYMLYEYEIVWGLHFVLYFIYIQGIHLYSGTLIFKSTILQ